jgi:molecular chaperone HtpG
MAPIPVAPNNYRDCLLYRTLVQKSEPGDGAVEKLDVLVESTTPLLDSIIAGPFKHFTLHNRDHAKKLVHLCEYVIDATTLGSLSIIECLMIAFAAYLHDLGMCLTSPQERKKILDSKELQDVIGEWPQLLDALKKSRKRNEEIGKLAALAGLSKDEIGRLEAERLQLEGDIFQLQEAALVAYLRPRHATEERYRQLFSMLKQMCGRKDLFEFRGVSFEQQLVSICVSHNLDAGVLSEVHATSDERFPRDLVISGQRLNSQFCAAVLRIVDILDFDRERTPHTLFESLGISGRSLPGADVSLYEWQKHMAVHSLDIRPGEIVVAAECKHPVIEKGIRDFCDLIEREVRDTSTVLAHNTAEITSTYKLRLPIVVRPQIASVGYVYKVMSLGMNQIAIMTLLMGEHLYSRKGVALRELIQNSVDACAVRQTLTADEAYKPLVSLGLYKDTVGSLWIEITDNGIGMDEHVLSEFFLRLGNSYYRSAEFMRISKGEQFVPISRFGIGIASLFMIGDALEVTTRASHSPRHDDTSRFVRIERMGALAYVSEHVTWSEGTRVRVRLKTEVQADSEHFIQDVSEYLRDIVVRPKVDVAVKIGTVPFTAKSETWLTLKDDAATRCASLGLEVISISLDEISSRISGVVFLFLQKTGDQLSMFDKNGDRIKVFSKISADVIFERYQGNRVTVNGFKMSLKKQRSLHSYGKTTLPLVFDIEIEAAENISFDIARDRLIGHTKPVIVNEFRRSIYRSLLQAGFLDRLEPDTRALVETVLLTQFPPPTASMRPVTDEELLERVRQSLPAGPWPTAIHKSIAERLHVSSSIVSRAISTLINRGTITKPFKEESPRE